MWAACQNALVLIIHGQNLDWLGACDTVLVIEVSLSMIGRARLDSLAVQAPANNRARLALVSNLRLLTARGLHNYM